MKLGRFLIALAACAFLFGCVSPAQTVETSQRPKNVILMIADGAGFNHFAAAAAFQSGESVAPIYRKFPVALAVSTFQAGRSYDPALAWADPGVLKSGATDSAAAATALASGVKTSNGALGVDAGGRPLRNILEAAEEAGKATGVVTTVQFSHATPAGFVVHQPGRNAFIPIAEEMLQQSAVDVIIGCGHPAYDNDGRPRETPRFKYIGEKDWQALLAGQAGAGVDADRNGVNDDSWSLVQTREEIQRLGQGPAPKRLFGIAPVADTLQQRRKSALADVKTEVPWQTPRLTTVPTLVEMTRAAMNVLDDDPEGFVLMIEGGAPDWAADAGESARLVEEMAGFNDAVAAVIEWVETRSNWSETLLVVTADHETGFLTTAPEPADLPPSPALPPKSNGPGLLPAMKWNSNGHTNSLVPLFALGPEAELFRTRATSHDPVRGPYLDNTAVAQVIMALLTPEPAPTGP